MDPLSVIANDTLAAIGRGVDDAIAPIRPALTDLTDVAMISVSNITRSVSDGIAALQAVCGPTGLMALVIMCGGFVALAVGSLVARNA